MSPNLPDHIVIDEVLPAASKAAAAAKLSPQASELAKFLAKWLDDLLRIPGTNFKIGLDPILALIPGLGDALSSGSGLIIVLEAVRSGVSMPVLLRMGANMGVNTVLDIIPGVGPVASAFFKSNSRNLRLLQHWQAGRQQVVRKSTKRLFLVFAILVAFLMVSWIASLWMFLHYVLQVV